MQTVGYRGAAIPAMPLYTSQVTMTPPIVLQQTRQPVQAPVTLAPALVRTVEAPSPAASSPATLWQVNLPHRPIPTEAADSVGGLRQVSARGAGLRSLGSAELGERRVVGEREISREELIETGHLIEAEARIVQPELTEGHFLPSQARRPASSFPCGPARAKTIFQPFD